MITIIGPDYPKIVMPLIDAAKKNIEIVMYDWRLYPDQPMHAVSQFNQCILRASRRGVQVRALVNAQDAAASLEAAGIPARCIKDRRTLHCKMLLIDRRLLVIGSHNISRNAFYTNLECSVVVELPEPPARLVQFFDNLWGV